MAERRKHVYKSVKDWLRLRYRFFPLPRAVISCPKSGRTWLRVMLDELNISAKYTHAGAGSGSPFLDEVDELEHRRYRRVLVLMRDPRDTAASWFHQRTKRKRRGSYSGNLSAFIRDPSFGIEKIARYNLLWAGIAAETSYVGVVTYERLLTETAEALVDITRFFSRPVSMAAATATAENNRFGKMREREANGAYREQYNGRILPMDPGDPNSFKVRRGRIGGHQEEMSAEDLAFCDEVLGRLDYFGKLDGFLRTASVGGPAARCPHNAGTKASQMPPGGDSPDQALGRSCVDYADLVSNAGCR